MSKKTNKPNIYVASRFNRNEKFGLGNVPKHFESVTDYEVRRIRDRVLYETENVTHNNPGALRDTLKSVDGSFASAYSTLEGDYTTRLSNLSNVHTKSVSDLGRARDAFALQVAEYNNALEDYLEASRNVGARELPENLLISDDEIAEVKQSVNELIERRNKNA